MKIPKRKIQFQDGFSINTEIKLMPVDRLRILFGARVSVNMVTQTQHICGEAETQTMTVIEKVLPILKLYLSMKFAKLFSRKPAARQIAQDK